MDKLTTLKGQVVNRIPFRAKTKEEQLAFRVEVEEMHKHDDPPIIITFNEWLKNFIESKAYKKCTDCGVADGEYHIPGCDQERCPLCGKQLISCEDFSDDDNLFH